MNQTHPDVKRHAPGRSRLAVLCLSTAFIGLAFGCGGGGGSSSSGTSSKPVAPAITTQPSNQSVSAGQSATFGVKASGTPLAYQWRRNGTAISGATSANFVTAAAVQADDGARFSVVVSNSAGSATSADATLTVTSAQTGAEFYVDPVSGSDQGDGSSSSPWKTLQTVIDKKVETRTWEALPYVAGMNLVPVNAGAPVKAGDTIWLRSGDYGALAITIAYNAAPVTLAAAAGQTPKFSKVWVHSSQNWTLRGFTVSPSFAATYSKDTIVSVVDDNNWSGPSYDVVIDGFEIFSVPDESVWTSKSDWDTKAADAVLAFSDRVTISNCNIRNVGYGIGATGKASRVEHNTIDGFCGDGLRGLGDDEVFEGNLVKNSREVNDDHRDGFQSWSKGADGNVGTGVVKNITLRGNTIIGCDDPSLPFVAGTLQGIGCFDGFFDGWVVEDNVILTDHWHGISFYGGINLRIVNNTVLDLNNVDPGPPWIMITDHNGTKSSNCVVRNNLTTSMNVSGDNIVEDHNIILPADAGASTGDTSGYFVDVVHHNVHLKAGSPAIDHGSDELAPTTDADGVTRPQGSAVDVGAYEYVP